MIKKYTSIEVQRMIMFHLREVGYVLKKLKIEWENISERPWYV